MLLLEKIIGLYAPHRCVACSGETNSLLCESCRETLPRVPSRCYRCRKVSRGYTTCSACKKRSPLQRVCVAVHYADEAKELLHRVKYERAQAGAADMANLFTPLIKHLPADALLVPIPTATSRVRQRGYDQAALLASQLAKLSGLSVAEALARQGQAHQVGASRRERIRHLEGAFRVTRPAALAGRHVVLVDDVLTTGATAETAAHAVKAAGAKTVSALIYSQPD